jgi:hypothetical protein
MIIVDLIRWELDGLTHFVLKPSGDFYFLPSSGSGVIIDGALAWVDLVTVDLDDNGKTVAIINCRSVERPCEPSPSPAS